MAMFILGLSTMLIGFPGPMELIIIFFIVLLLFGANKMPEIARSLGKGMREFRKASDEIKSGFNEKTSISSPKSSPKEVGAEESEEKEDGKSTESKPSTPSKKEDEASEPDESETSDKGKSTTK
jgi:sec-independent protein translocase protein TatA